jgi:tetratricopeptide (TPR) repeat protein
VFFILPLSLALASLIGIIVVVYRKMPYLRKLSPEAHPAGQTVLHDYAPELIDWAASVPWRRFLHNMLVEFEKLLRKGRLLMSSLDRVSDRVIRKVRTVHQETAKQQEAIVAQREEAAQQAEESDEIDMDDPEQLRQEEQRLIVAIAQNPKDSDQIIRLARVYMRLRAFGDAVEALEAALKFRPDDEILQKRLKRAREMNEKQLPATPTETL